MDIAPAPGLPADFDFDTVVETADEMLAEISAEIADLQKRARFLQSARDHFADVKARRAAAHEAALSA